MKVMMEQKDVKQIYINHTDTEKMSFWKKVFPFKLFDKFGYRGIFRLKFLMHPFLLGIFTIDLL